MIAKPFFRKSGQLFFCFQFLFLNLNIAVDRRITLEQIEKGRAQSYTSVLDLARFALKQKRVDEALKETLYHQKNQPSDPEGYLLEAKIWAMKQNSERRLLALKKAYFLLQDPKLLTEIEALSPSSLTSAPEATAKPEVKSTPATAPATVYLDADFRITSLLRTANSLYRQCKSLLGECKDFSKESLKAAKILSQPPDFSDLGTLSIQEDQVFSSLYGSLNTQTAQQKRYYEALELYRKGLHSAVASLFSTSAGTLRTREIELYIESSEALNQTSKALQLREELLRKNPSQTDLLAWLAAHYYNTNQKDKAKSAYQKLQTIENYKALAEERLKILELGGSGKLQTLLEEERKKLFPKSIKPVESLSSVLKSFARTESLTSSISVSSARQMTSATGKAP